MIVLKGVHCKSSSTQLILRYISFKLLIIKILFRQNLATFA